MQMPRVKKSGGAAEFLPSRQNLVTKRNQGGGSPGCGSRSESAAGYCARTWPRKSDMRLECDRPNMAIRARNYALTPMFCLRVKGAPGTMTHCGTAAERVRHRCAWTGALPSAPFACRGPGRQD